MIRQYKQQTFEIIINAIKNRVLARKWWIKEDSVLHQIIYLTQLDNSDQKQQQQQQQQRQEILHQVLNKGRDLTNIIFQYFKQHFHPIERYCNVLFPQLYLDNLITMVRLMGPSLPYHFGTHGAYLLSKIGNSSSFKWYNSSILLTDAIVSSFIAAGQPPPQILLQFLNTLPINPKIDRNKPTIEWIEPLIHIFDLTKRVDFFQLAMQLLFKTKSSSTQSIMENLFQSHPTAIKEFFTKQSNVDRMDNVTNLSLVINCIVQSLVPANFIKVIMDKSSPSRYNNSDNKVIFTSSCTDLSKASIMFIDIMFEGLYGTRRWTNIGTDTSH
ncbi:hypothetical protein SAMD00019534_116740 [Acytostelium subglobosum LB1]|uniref:hypothetical protein n=1 Tax=Acytostelium subglobosum LB1 TaxID=1410327 RepID=UPI000644E0F0|nr:hypothetical protein SAMD00019534_116740 [Acytostelium subglobosum LB1]GAM28498.1 hypothetical protein SAMD00019534_116740 [Acytostelium subglobosum LB1]|eukprot:XP_012748537.1 hypothetical protein SAMD00019534_116740 [Acytostelium subglobosum LB1]